MERSRNQHAENKAHEHVHTGNQSGGHATLRIVLQNKLLSLATWQISFFIMISYDASGLPCTHLVSNVEKYFKLNQSFTCISVLAIITQESTWSFCFFFFFTLLLTSAVLTVGKKK